MHYLIERVFMYDDHQASLADRSLSTTTIIGPAYKAKLALEKRPRTYWQDPIKKRGATIGTGFHMRAEKVLSESIDYIVERYAEREIDGVTISGTADILERQGDNTYKIYDWKTGVKQSYDKESQERTRLQLSIYRWLFQYTYDIQEIGTILYISTSKNNVEDIEVDLMSYAQVEEYLSAKLWQIENQETADCKTVLGSWACDYCDFDCNFRE